MRKKLSKKLKYQRFLAILVLLFGGFLLIYMVVVEHEPGAVPLILIIAGTIWITLNEIKIKNTFKKANVK